MSVDHAQQSAGDDPQRDLDELLTLAAELAGPDEQEAARARRDRYHGERTLELKAGEQGGGGPRIVLPVPAVIAPSRSSGSSSGGSSGASSGGSASGASSAGQQGAAAGAAAPAPAGGSGGGGSSNQQGGTVVTGGNSSGN